jgi:hypothetical protein
LKLCVNSVTTAGSFNVDYVNGTWAESTIDASNAPALGKTIASGINMTTADKNQYILINVTSAVQAWLSGNETNNGIALPSGITARVVVLPAPATPSRPTIFSRERRISSTAPTFQPTSISWNRVELYNEVWNQPLVKLSRKYGVSDVRLGKVCRKLKIPHPARGYWAKRAVGHSFEQVPLPEFKDAPVVKRLIRKSKPKIQRGRKIVPQKGALRKSLRKQFLKFRLGIRV